MTDIEERPSINNTVLYKLLCDEKNEEYQEPFALYLENHNSAILIKDYDSKNLEYQVFNVSLGQEKLT